jgi:hypothetical protein
MLCTFITEHGTLVVRSDDIRVIENAGPEQCRLIFMIGTDATARTIEGTASENRDRILQEELDQIGVVELHRYRTQQLLQAQPTPRGRQSQ